MSNIVEKIKDVPELLHLTGCLTSQIRDAQETLGLVFPEEFVDYVKEFGVISFYGTEWTGLNVDGYLNVVTATEQERNTDTAFPGDMFVIENIGMDRLMTLMGTDGKIYSYMHGTKTALCDSLAEYLTLCIARNH